MDLVLGAYSLKRETRKKNDILHYITVNTPSLIYYFRLSNLSNQDPIYRTSATTGTVITILDQSWWMCLSLLLLLLLLEHRIAFGGDSTFMVDDVKVVPLPEMGNCGYGIGPFRPRQTLLA